MIFEIKDSICHGNLIDGIAYVDDSMCIGNFFLLGDVNNSFTYLDNFAMTYLQGNLWFSSNNGKGLSCGYGDGNGDNYGNGCSDFK
jgi:hypothetical protein